MTPARTVARPVRRPAVLLALALGGSTALAVVPALPSAGSAPVRVVVTGTSVAAAAEAVRAAGGTVLDRLGLVDGVSAELPVGAALDPALLVVPDHPLTLAGRGAGAGGAVSTGPRATLGLGAAAGEGAGITVAVVDTGIADVPALAGRVRHVDATGTGTGDAYGHGTFIGGLVGGAGGDGVPAGIAPGADLLDVRVADGDGTTDLVTVLRGLQAVAADPSVDVLNLSLSSGSPLPHQIDPLAVALDALWRRGVTVVVPAGNDGGTRGTIASPGSDPLLLTVGGLDEGSTPARTDDTVAAWSGRGPAPQGVAKPDLVAPGASLVSLRSPGSTIDRTHPEGRVGEHGFRGSGTSFATAVTSGAVAALLAERDLTPDQVKAVLQRSAYDTRLLRSPDAAGAGGLDLAAALQEKAPSADVAAREDRGRQAVPGDPATWQALLDGVLDGDEQAAARSWAALTPDARAWASRTWAALDPALREHGTRMWSTRAWAGQPRHWASVEWAARTWAGRNWAGEDWSAGTWAGSSWSGSSWSGSSWSGSSWSGSSWSGSSWSGSSWSGSSWSASSWS